MSKDDSNASFQLSLSRKSLDSEVLNRNDDETTSIASSRSFENDCISKIIQVLDLDNTADSEILVKQLMIKGRQNLKDYEQDVSKTVFKKQMETDQSGLLDILKTYIEQQWKETITEQWFHRFLQQQKLQSTPIYNKVLTRIAEYGSTYTKDNTLLSLTIQFLFEFDDEITNIDSLFNRIWNTLISEGPRGIQHYKEYISPKLLKEQLENNQSPLYLALKDYYRSPLQNLFQHNEINIHNKEIFQIALDSVTNHGWWLGLNEKEVTDTIAPRKSKKLIEKLKEYLTSQGLSIPNQSSSSNDNAGDVSGERSALTNTQSHLISSKGMTDGTEVGSLSNSSSNKDRLSEDSQKKAIGTSKTSASVVEKEDNDFNKFKNKLKLLWTKYEVDGEMDFNYVAQQLFNQNTKILEEVKDYMLPDNFSRFKQELLECDQFKQFSEAKEAIESNLIENNFIKFKSVMIKLFESQNIQLNETLRESLLQKLYKNKDNNIADLLKECVIPKKIRPLITKIQLNEELKTIWTANMSIFNNMKSILEKYMDFTSGNSANIFEIISELYADSDNGMKLIESKWTPEKFRKIKSDLYNNAEIRSKVFHEKINVIPIIIKPVDIEKNKNEISIISSCTNKHSDRLQLENLVEAGELQYINRTLKDISEKLVDNFHQVHHLFPQFIQECSTPILYLLKRLQNLDDFMNILTFEYQRIRQRTNYQSTKITNLSLRMILHVLFMSSDIFLRRIIMSLVSKRNPVPFISPSIQNGNNNEQYEFMPAIIHVWNYTRPTILSFGIGPCKGKSTLLNQLFQSTFEQTVDSIYFQQTIDIDFGYCFNPERTLNIADTHGMMDIKLLEKIQSLFDGFLIHIDKAYFDQEPNTLFEYIKVLPPEKFRMIIIRDMPSQSSEEDLLKINTERKETNMIIFQNLHIHPLINISNTNDRDTGFAINNLREEILTKIKNEIRKINDKHDILVNLQNLLANDYVAYLMKMNQIIQPLKQRLLQKNQGYNQENFPLYLKFQELCKLRQRLKKLDFYGSESEDMFDINTKLSALENELDPNAARSSPIKTGYVFQKFIEILKSDDMLMSLDLLASELKYELSSLGGDRLAGNLVVEHAFLSLEVLWRNAIVCYDHTTNDNQRLITDSYCNFIAGGFPFEIIDGDNFHFQQQFLTKILDKFNSKRMLVISIIGPQNSGKSTLLNYMFGTLFDVREGRCTRGIYGSLVKLNKSNQTGNHTLKKLLGTEIRDLDYIMLIDTEGLLSIEKGDKEYDRRIVLFCLAISHLVIVNMMGDVNETLKDMLTLCADSLMQIGVNTTNQPIVHFVLNQKADPNLENHKQAIGKIIDDLKEKQLAEVIDISDKTFHTLPSAFKKERASSDTKSPCFLRTEPDFIERTQQLCEKFIESAKSSYGRSGDAFSNPPQWLLTAINIFDTLQKFPDLTYFKDINERRHDDQIRKEIGELMSKTLSPFYREQMIREACERTEDEIRRYFQAKFDVHQNNFDNDLENIFKITNASERIRDRCQQFLKRQVTEISNAWCTAAIQVSDQKQMEKLVKDGSADLHNLIVTIINSGKTMTKEKATQEFEIMWTNKVKSIEDNFNPENRLRQAIKFVYGNYNIFEKQCLPSLDNILTRLYFISQLSQEANMDGVVTSIESQFVRNIVKLHREVLEQARTRSSTNVAYTIATLQNFKYLNKHVLSDLYTASTLESENQDQPSEQYSQRQKPKSPKPNVVRRGLNAAAGLFGVGSKTQSITGTSSSGKVIPLRFDFMKQVHKTIFNEMGTDPNKESNILNISEVFHTIIQKTKALVHGDDSVVRPIEIDLVQKIVGLLNTYINEINLELLVFNLLLSKQTKAEIHSYILMLLTIYYYGEQQRHFVQQLSTLKKEKASLLNYFISMIVPDAECDKKGAELFANEVKNAIQSNLMQDAQKVIRDAIQSQKTLNRREIQKICDGKLAVASNDWLFSYIVTPTNIIVEEFKNRWEAVEKGINQQLLNKKAQWKNILTEFFQQVNLMNTLLQNEGSTVQYVNDIFEAYDGGAADNLTNKGQCMASLLYEYLSGDTIKAGKSYIVFKKNYTLKSKGSTLFENLPTLSGQLTTLVKKMKRVDGSNSNGLVILSIKNLRIFLQSIMDVKNAVEQGYDANPATFTAFDIDQIYNKLLDKTRGCTSKCPCCDRPCDVDHSLVKSNPGDEDNRHACQTGHQLRAMAGFKFEVTNEASLFQCEIMTDESPIIVRGTKKKWSEFKEDYPNWDFGNSIMPEELFRIRGRFLTVWSKIGQRLCDKYDMKFITENTLQVGPKPFHYILLLDASGSMNGKPWQNLLEGVNSFVKIRIDFGAADRITIIVFNTNATYAYFNVDMKTVNTAQIKFTSGETDFSSAFDLVIKTMKNTPSQNSIVNSSGNLDFIIIFMSDGQATCPDAQLNTLLTMKSQINQFWTVALGDTKMDVLEEINDTMDGVFKELKDSDDLVDVYAEIAHT